MIVGLLQAQGYPLGIFAPVLCFWQTFSLSLLFVPSVAFEGLGCSGGGLHWPRCLVGVRMGMHDSMYRFYSHRPRYHHGLSKREHIEQVTGDWWVACYGVPRYSGARMRCYGMPRVWGWSIKDPVEGPRSLRWRRQLRRIMRKRARRAARQWIDEQIFG